MSIKHIYNVDEFIGDERNIQIILFWYWLRVLDNTKVWLINWVEDWVETATKHYLGERKYSKYSTRLQI
jgi:hypothetical protein